MATGGSGDEIEAEDGENKLTCAMCLEKYRRPKLLPCLHTFCQSCLQGLAGSSSSFTCPSCRTPVLLPPGGVRALETNVYTEQDLDAATSSPQQRLCDVCAEDREATHTCMQCQQRLCLPCTQCHDALKLSRGHTVVSLMQEEEIPLSDKPENKQEIEMCPNHTDQFVSFHCNQCEVDMCMQCKLTQHVGHPTDDLADFLAKVKVKVQEMLGSVTQRMKHINHLIVAVEERCTKLHQLQQITEQDFKSRADTLYQWVRQSLAEAVASVQSTAKQLEKSLQDQAEQLRTKNLMLQAKKDFAMGVLRCGKIKGIGSLEAQHSISLEVEVMVKQMEKEVTQKLPAFHVKHSTTVVNPLQLRTFVGVLEPVQQPQYSEGTASPLQSQCAVKGAESLCRADLLSSANSSELFYKKTPPTELISVASEKMYVHGICSISQSRLWVWYTDEKDDDVLKLFDGKGRLMTTLNDIDIYCHLFTFSEDILACSWSGERHTFVDLIRPDGSHSRHKIKIQFDRIVSCLNDGNHYLRDKDSGKLYRVKFNYADNKLTHSEREEVFDEIPRGDLMHVSADGSYFAFDVYDYASNDSKVEVYTKAGRHRHRLISSYTTRTSILRACFCHTDGQQRLLVTVDNDNKVHVVDHTDGCRFVRHLDTAPLELERPFWLATDYDHHVWIMSCGEPRKLVMVEL